MASVLNLVRYHQKIIEKYPENIDLVLSSIEQLYNLNVTVSHLQVTGIGRTVNALRKEPDDVGSSARALVYKWKCMVSEAESEQEVDDDEATCSDYGSGRDSDDNTGMTPPIVLDGSSVVHHIINNDCGANKRRYSTENEERESKVLRYSNSSDLEDNKGNYYLDNNLGQIRSSEISDNIESHYSDSDTSSYSRATPEICHKLKTISRDECYLSPSPSSIQYNKEISATIKLEDDSQKHIIHYSSESRDSSDQSSSRQKSHRTQKKETNEKTIDSEKKYKSDHKMDDKDKKREKEREKSSNTLTNDHNSSESHKYRSGKHSSESEKNRSYSDDHKSKSKTQSSKSTKDYTIEKNKSHESSTSKVKHASIKEMSKEKSTVRDKRKEKSKDCDNSKEKTKDRDNSKEKTKDRDISKERLKDRDNSKEKSKDRIVSSKEKPVDSPKSDKRKHTSDNNKSKSSDSRDEIGSNNKIETSKSKHKSNSLLSHQDTKSKNSSKTKVTAPKKENPSHSEDSEDGIDCGSGASFAEVLGMISPVKTKKKSSSTKTPQPSFSASVLSNDMSPASLLSPSAKLAPLPVLEISALPEISPNYKPRPPPKKLPHFSEEEAMSHVLTSKNQRTKVYSGNKTWGKVPSLFEMCVQILQEHIDALEYTGGVPYEILKPVIDKATPHQLFMLEHFNPYLMEDTDHLWQKFCEKNFRNKKRQEMETWREMYMRCQEEQECKLKSLTANIKIAQEAKKAPIKQTKMAYVDSIVKPPRNIARKQALHGTAHISTASPAARVAALATVSNVLRGGTVRPTPAAPVSSSSFQKPKKAPLMQKALQFMRGRKR